MELRFDGPVFYSAGDEASFFQRLEEIGCISDIRGTGSALIATLNDSQVPEAELREFLAIFTRYRIDSTVLAQFETSKNRRWFRENRNAFWHRDVFPSH